MATTECGFRQGVIRRSVNAVKILTLVMGATALAACGQTTTIERASLAVKADAHEAVALPPPGGPAVISVIERRFSNAIQQDIILSTSATTPGQNMLRVQMFGSIG